MPSNKRRSLRTLITASLGCGCGCGCDKPDLSYIHVHEPSPPTPKITIHSKPNPCSHTPSTSTTSGERTGSLSMVDHEDLTSTVISEAEADHHKMMWGSCSIKNTVHQGNKLLIDSIAVEKESEDPYKDFRMSMLQMIFEKEISAEVDLQELLACLLALNSPCHHEVILEAFSQIRQEAFPEERVQAADHDRSSKKPDRASSTS